MEGFTAGIMLLPLLLTAVLKLIDIKTLLKEISAKLDNHH